MSCDVAPDQDHDRLRFGLMDAGLRMADTSERPEAFPETRDRLVAFCNTKLLPHLERDERWLLEAQRCPEGRLLAEAMRAHARMMRATVEELSVAPSACEAMGHTRVLHTLLAAHDHHQQLLRTASAA